MSAALLTARSAPSASRGIALAAVSFAVFSTADATLKVLSGGYGVFQIAFIMACFALLPVVVVAVMEGGLHTLKPRQWRPVALRGVMSTVGALLAWHAFALLPLADAYAILFASPLLVTAMSPWFLGESVGWRRWGAVLVGFAGVLVMIRPGFQELSLGHALAAGATVFGAIAFVMVRKVGARETSGVMLLGLILALMTASAPLAAMEWVQPRFQDLGLMALAGILQGAGQIGIVLATRDAPASVVVPFQYTQMLWAVLYGIMLFGNVPGSIMLIGVSIVIGSNLYILIREGVRHRAVVSARPVTSSSVAG